MRSSLEDVATQCRRPGQVRALYPAAKPGIGRAWTKCWCLELRRTPQEGSNGPENKELTHDCVVCGRHFEERFVEKTYRHIINGEVVETPRDRPQLRADAVPTVFPDAPKYFTTKAPIKRKERNLCEQHGHPTKKQKVHDGSTEGELPQDAAADAQPPQEQRAVGHPEAEVLNAMTADVCRNLLLPSPSWNKLTFGTEQDAVHFGLCELEGEQADHML